MHFYYLTAFQLSCLSTQLCIYTQICIFQILEHPNLLTEQEIQQETVKQEVVINRSTRGFSASFCTTHRVLVAGWTRCIDGYELAYLMNSRSFPLKALPYQLWKWNTCLIDIAVMFVQLHICFNQHVLKTAFGYISNFLFSPLSAFIKTVFLLSRLAITNFYSCKTEPGLPSSPASPLWTSILSRCSKSNARIERFPPLSPKQRYFNPAKAQFGRFLCVT